MLVQVALNLPVRGEFTYLVPPSLRGLRRGGRVRVPFGRRVLTGVVMRFADRGSRPEGGLREVQESLDAEPMLDERELQLLADCAAAHYVPAGELIHASMPPLLRASRPFRPDCSYRAVSSPTLNILPRGEARVLDKVAAAGGISHRETMALPPRDRAHLRSLAVKGLVVAETDPASYSAPPEPREGPRVSAAKAARLKRVAKEILAAEPAAGESLLMGPSGEERIEACLRLLERMPGGSQALVLAPESRRAGLWARRIAARLPGKAVGLLHADLPERRRAHAWLAASRGDLEVLVGTRSAALAPLPGIALAIVDDAHARGLVRADSPRHSAVSAARMRCRGKGARLVLCSATPSLEDYHRATSGSGGCSFHTLRGIARPRRSRIEVHDLRSQQSYHGLAAPLISRIKRRIRKGDRVAVVTPGDGWAVAVRCSACGRVESCPGCATPLSVHFEGGLLRCGLCGFERVPPESCAECGGKMRHAREGSAQVEAGLRKTMPDARILREDARGEELRGPGAGGQGDADLAIISRMTPERMEALEPDLVVIASVDGRLMSGDFRSAESLCADLSDLAQLSSGARTAPALAIQTRAPGHPLIAALLHDDVEGYWRRLLRERKAAGLPPYGALGVVRAWGKERDDVMAAVKKVRDAFERESTPALDALGVKAMGIIRSGLRPRAGIQRFHFAVRAPTEEGVREALDWAAKVPAARGGKARVEFEADPRRL